MDFKKHAQPGLFDAMRQKFADVSRQSRSVTINHAKIREYALSLTPLAKDDVYDTDHHFIGDDEETAAYVMMLDSINFGGTLKRQLEREGLELVDESLYFTMATRLKRIFECDRPLMAEDLVGLDVGKTSALLGLRRSSSNMKWLAESYTESLRELGEFILRDHDGRFMSVIETADGSVEKLVEDLAKLPSFNDVVEYNGIQVPLYKRAQITAADLHLAFAHKGQQLFNDIDELTTFPDNAVAHTLREDDILIYSDDLASRVANGVPLQVGSAEEVEIRACTAHAVELIRSHRPELTSVDIDHILWHRSHEPSYLQRPHHKVWTVFY